MRYNVHTETKREIKKMKVYAATDYTPPRRLRDADGNTWSLNKKPDSRDNCYLLDDVFYFSRRVIMGYPINSKGLGIDK